MKDTRKKIIYTGLAVSLLASITAPSAAFASSANDNLYAATANKKEGKCLDTSSQKETNDKITQDRVLYPRDKGSFVITSSFGPRVAPVPGAYNYHYGVDMKSGKGSPIYAAADGEVYFSGIEPFGGQLILIKHVIDDKVYYSRYNHMLYGSEKVKAGDIVKAGDLIGNEGTTGLSTGYHLHFEILKDHPDNSPANSIDSLQWLKDNSAQYRTDPISLKSLSCEVNTIVTNPNSEWGGFKNGEIPAERLKALSWNKSAKLEINASNQLESLNKEFKKKFKKNLPITTAYKSLKNQKDKPDLSMEGQSFYGWGKSIELNFTHATNDYIPLISEPNYFTDPEYKWLKDNGHKHGWIALKENFEKGTNPDPKKWVYNKSVTEEGKKANLQNYTKVATAQYDWQNEKNRTCTNEIFNQTKWDIKYQSGKDRLGIANLSPNTVKKYSTDPIEYATNGQEQIRTTLSYVTDKYKTPCNALNTLKKVGKI